MNRWNRFVRWPLALALVGLLLGTLMAPTSAGPRFPKITFISTVTRPISLPWMVGLRLAEAEDGIPFEVRELRESEAAVLGVAQERGQLGLGFHAVFPAIERGAPVVNLMEISLPEFVLIARREVPDVRALHGVTVASHSARSTQKVLLDFFLERDHLGITPSFVYMPAGSAARADSLLAGAVPAATMDITFAQLVMRRAPGRFHILLDMTRLPVSSSYLIAHRDFVERSPELVQRVIRRILESYRRGIENPAFWVQQRGDLFREISAAELEVQLRELVRLFDPNGGIDRLRGIGAIDNISFQVVSGNLSGPVMKWRPGTFFAPEPLDTVLRQIGRR